MYIHMHASKSKQVVELFRKRQKRWKHLAVVARAAIRVQGHVIYCEGSKRTIKPELRD